MAGNSAEEAETMRALWVEAETKVASGQEYEIAGRRLKRADLDMIGARIKYWNAEVQRLSSGTTGARVRGLTLG